MLLLSSVPLSSGAQITNALSLNTGPRDNCDLQCWLAQLTILIPDQYFNQTILLSELRGSITNFKCTGISLGGIKAGIVPPLGLSVDVTGVGVRCSGNWAYSWFIFSGNGNVSANVSGSSPEAGIMNMNGLPGVAPVMRG